MRRIATLAALALAGGATGCATINERVLYREAIDSFAPRVLKGDNTRIWITQDMRGGIKTAIAEEVFINYIVEKGLALVIEKHPDNLAGIKDKDAPAKGGEGVSVVNNVGAPEAGGGLFGGAVAAALAPTLSYDNNLSNDLHIEKEKKRTAAKVLVWRVDELTGKKCVVHFRLADAATGVIEFSDTVTVEVESRSSESPARAPAGGGSPPKRRD